MQAVGQATRALGTGRIAMALQAPAWHDADQDGSTHEWVPGCLWDLVVTLDDATTEIYSVFFVEEEGTLSRFRGTQEGIETKRLSSALYTDRGSHYWHTDGPGGFCTFKILAQQVVNA